jgi:hypothetical protein
MRDVVNRVVLDVDTGIDDALALLYAVATRNLILALSPAFRAMSRSNRWYATPARSSI